MRWLIVLLLLANVVLFGWSWQEGHWNSDPYADVPVPERGAQMLEGAEVRIRPLEVDD